MSYQHVGVPQLALSPSECQCAQCQSGCRVRPCWTDPDGGARLQAAHPDKVVFDTDVHVGNRTLRVIRPAAVGETPGSDYFGSTGVCVFYKRGKCELHHTDLKPLEGRLMSHELSERDLLDLRIQVAALWR